jgi:hypothetical protein
MGWNYVLRLLRRVSKKVYNYFSKTRSEEEAIKFEMRLGRWFEIEEDLIMEGIDVKT